MKLPISQKYQLYPTLKQPRMSLRHETSIVKSKIDFTPINVVILSSKSFVHSFIHSFVILDGHFTWLKTTGPYRATTCRVRKLTLDHIHTLLTTQGHRGPPRMRDMLNVGATPETWKTIHTIHAPIHTNKENIKGWLWRPNDIRGPCGPNASWHLSYRWGKTPNKPHSENLSRPGIELRPAAWQAGMLPPAPQWWTLTGLTVTKSAVFNIVHEESLEKMGGWVTKHTTNG